MEVSILWEKFVNGNQEYGRPYFLAVACFLFSCTYMIVGILYSALDIWHFPRSLYNRKIQKKIKFDPEGSNGVPSFRRLMRRTITSMVFVIFPGIFFLDTACLKIFGWSIKISPELPSLKEMILKTILNILLIEIMFYYSHYLLHHPSIYGYIHKKHHEFKAPIALAAIYAHPLEIFVGNTLAVIGPSFFLELHLFHFYLGIIFGIISTMHDHSGYQLEPWNSLQPKFHDLHHEKFNYNFGVIGLLDWLHGTNYVQSSNKSE